MRSPQLQPLQQLSSPGHASELAPGHGLLQRAEARRPRLAQAERPLRAVLRGRVAQREHLCEARAQQ